MHQDGWISPEAPSAAWPMSYLTLGRVGRYKNGLPDRIIAVSNRHIDCQHGAGKHSHRW